MRNALTIVDRELRTSARHSATYWLRVGGAATALIVATAFLPVLRMPPANAGAAVFAEVHRLVFVCIWLGVPWLAGDCISRERREGTLGLLFLTPLKPMDIVVAKALVHGVRALSVWLAVLPVMSLAFFLGGVSWDEALLSAGITFSSLLVALGASVLASAACGGWSRAMILSTGAAMIALVCYLGALCWLLFFAGGIPQSPGFLFSVQAGGCGALNLNSLWQVIVPRLGTSGVLSIVLALMSLAFGWLCLAIAVSAVLLRRNWRDRPPSRWQLRLGEFFCAPRFWQPGRKRSRRWQLELNPVGWLGQRTWSGRVVVWGAAAALLLLYSSMDLFASPAGFSEAQVLIAGALMTFIAASSAGSLRVERDSGVLELLMVAPFRERQFILGHLLGVWWRFLPVVAVMLFVWVSLGATLGLDWVAASALFVGCSFVSLPIIGMHQSLRRRSYTASLVWTLGVGALVPFLVSSAFVSTGLAGSPANYIGQRLLAAGLTQVDVAVVCAGLLYRNLVKRRFALDQWAG